MVAKNRYLTFSAGTPGVLGGEAIRITFVSLPGAYASWNGAELWVSQPALRSEVSSLVNASSAPPSAPKFFQSTLQCAPNYRDWTQFDQLHVTHEGIIPGGEYVIQVIHRGCETSSESDYTAPATLINSRWGDVVSNCTTTPCGPPNNIIDIGDVVAILDKFRNAAGAAIKSRTDLEPRVPDLLINITDVTSALGAFRSGAYPFLPSGGPPCP
jgi:hypothetical protein